MLIFILLTAVMLGFFVFGLALFTDFRGVATHYSARNRAAVEDVVLKGHNAGYFLVFGKNRMMGTILMILGGFGLLISVLGLVGSLVGNA